MYIHKSGTTSECTVGIAPLYVYLNEYIHIYIYIYKDIQTYIYIYVHI
jgi:hypothetical protein